MFDASKTLLPSTAITPADALVIVVSVALPTLIAVNCGLFPVPSPKLVLAVLAVAVNSLRLLLVLKNPVPDT